MEMGNGWTGNAELRGWSHPVGQGLADPAHCLFCTESFPGTQPRPFFSTPLMATSTEQQSKKQQEGL